MSGQLISIIIVNYNVRELVLACLESIYAFYPRQEELQVIVVDNQSTDASVEAIREQFPQVELIANDFNAGFSGGNNQGMLLAKGKYVFLLNPDTEIVGSALQQLNAYLDDHPDCSMVTPQLLNSDRSLQISVWKNHHPIDLISESFFLHKLFPRLNYPIETFKQGFKVQSASGAALFFRKTLIDRIGMLNESLFWMEDIDFSKRARQQGYIWYLSDAQVLHHSGQSQKKNYRVAISNQLLSKLKYYKVQFHFGWFCLATFSCLLFILSRLIAFSLLSPMKEVYRLKAQAYAYSLKRYVKYLFLGEQKLT